MSRKSNAMRTAGTTRTTSGARWVLLGGLFCLSSGAASAQTFDGFGDKNFRGSACRGVRDPVALPSGGADRDSVTLLVQCVQVGLRGDLDNIIPTIVNDHEKLEDAKKKADKTERDLNEEAEYRLKLTERVEALELKSEGNGGKSNGGSDSALAARVAALEGQVSALQSAVAALKAQNQAGQSVRAPFQVVDAANKPLFRVAQAGNGARVSVITGAGQAAVDISSDKGGAIGLADTTGAQRAQLGLEADGRYSMTLFSAQKQPVAKVSSAKSGAGGVIGVFDTAGVPRIFMDGGTPTLLVQDGKAQPVAVLGMEEGHGVLGILYNGTTLAGLGAYSAGGAGRLWVNDSTGNWLFKAGKNESGGDACASSGKGVRCLAAGLR